VTPDGADPEIVLVRHATTADTRAGRFSGPEPTPLDDRGRAQADALRDRLGARTFDQVLVSPIARARETATRAGLADRDGRIEPVDALVEWRYGELLGRRNAEVRAEDPSWELWATGAPGGEAPTDVERRLAPVLDRLRTAPADVAVVSHGHVLRALVAGWLGLPLASAGALVIDPASVTELGRRHGRPALITLNDRSHVPGDAR
jgi:broad specificity phosphatase PhoE